MEQRPTFTAFLAAFVHSWAALMSGGISVPTVAWGLFVAPESQKELFFGLGVLCLVLASYLVWAKERSNVLALEKPGGPDWRIGELFAHLKPNLAQAADMKEFERLGMNIRDKLSTRQLRMWGRRKAIDSRYGSDPPLTEISPEYWSGGDFTYFFLLEGHEEMTHTRGAKFDHEDYHDLHVNRAEALRLWPASRKLGRFVHDLHSSA